MKHNTIFEKTKAAFSRWRKSCIGKTTTGSVLSVSITAFFALYNGFLGLCLSSAWHGSICVYYFLFAAIRGIILLAEKRSGAKSEPQKTYYRQRAFAVNAIMLLFLNLALIFPISLMVMFKKPVNMGLIPAIAMAAYTTYKITMASIHLLKQKRRSASHVLVAELRTLSFIDALVSILTLQNTLIIVNQTKPNSNDMFTLSAVTSAVIYLVIVFISIRFLMRSLYRKDAPKITQSPDAP